MKQEAIKRKQTPVFSGVLKYFPDAIQEIARVSFVGNEQHNPGKDLFWDRSKSGDELDALTRHLIDAGTLDTDGTRHSAKVAWRALANLQKELENDNQQEIEERIIKESEEISKMYDEEVETFYGPCAAHSFYSDELEERMNVIGQNGNTGEHYE